MQTLLIVIIAIVLLGGGYYYYSQQDADTTTNVEQTNGLAAPTENPIDNNFQPKTGQQLVTPAPDTGPRNTKVSTTKEFTFTNQGFSFNPKSFTVKKGDRVKVTFKNGGGTHDFRIDKYNIGTKVLESGASETFEFVATDAGTFEFYCSVGNHRTMGMKGTFVVTE